MNNILNELGLQIEKNWDSNIFATDNIIKYLIIPPMTYHNYYTLRISTCAAFDRWANSIPIEEFFDTEKALIDYIKNNQLKIYKTLLEYLSNEYYDLRRDYE